ncbi:T9SS type A sorting domain-containing protein [Chryseobacterium chendengshani]|uniref:Ig-like domain-containing protein n=1 Tax=Chryseobacterium sp. LJ668 TaxID=2864040 RepID=UPI001C68D6D4|nr:T9SS type A sorting domain-containing protein [Chryseobacterium sp. LJ668]MBW8522346.1 T9SS type A sorting domain-containing protein [Chryseobacterium sp. LJ668]QYK17985.1 T9SS type A sorting domain-containing protein [Chryseobacterium sp. LJ668]
MKHFYKLFSLICLVFLLVGYSNFNAQVSAYSFAQSSGTYTPIAGTILGSATGNTSATNLNSEVYSITLPFGFKFNDTSYTSLNVSSNGFITFGTTPPLTSTTAPISVTVAYSGAVSAFGRDINSIFDVAGVTGNISWEVLGTSPNREVVIQWKDFRPTNTTSTTAAYTFSFQIRLQETTNIIKAIYSNGSYLVGSTSYSSTVQVGLRGSTNLDFNTRLNATTTEFINSTAGTANSSVQNFSTTSAIPGMPTAGLTYAWTPPACYVPSGLSLVSTATTSANISWNATSSAPGSGYEVYYSTLNTAPTSSTVPQLQNINTASAVLPSLLPSTVYYVWVRSNCGSGNMSVWSLEPLVFITQCQPPALLTTSGSTVCPNQPATLSATTASGAILTWYDAATAGNVLTTGSSYTTPSLVNTTNYWVTASSIGSDQFVGKTSPTATTGNSTFTNYGLVFDAFGPMTIKEVDVYPMHATSTTGTVTINLKSSAGTILATQVANVNVSVAGILNTITLNFEVPSAGTDYRLVVDAATGISNLRREITTGFAYPYTLPGVCTITAASFGANPSASYYYYLYNWKVAGKCESSRTMVTATVDSNCLSTYETDKKDVIKVYPNPFSEVININKPELVKAISVSELSGKLLRTINQPESVVRLDDLSAGMYILQLDMKDGSTQAIKVIKK